VRAQRSVDFRPHRGEPAAARYQPHAETFVRKFRQAVALLGNEPPPSRRPMKVIDADDADHH
jgi:hypothetical protein